MMVPCCATERHIFANYMTDNVIKSRTDMYLEIIHLLEWLGGFTYGQCIAKIELMKKKE